MLSIIQTIAERKIQQAMEEGTLPDLSHWKGKPLPADDLSGVPEELRMAYRLLKNGGYVPEELALQKEITRIEQLLENCRDEKEKLRQLNKVSCLRAKLERRLGRAPRLGEDGAYYNQIVDRLAPPKTPTRNRGDGTAE